jgi:cytoskeletal protein CcmA (bactofilin family)
MKKTKKSDSISTFFGFGSRINGTIEFQNTMRLDGNVIGKIYGDRGTVIIGEKAVVEAEIIVDVAIVKGKVNGIIEASERIEIYSPGRVVGDIQSPVVLIEAGVVFNGKCVMTAKNAPMQKRLNPLKKLSIRED